MFGRDLAAFAVDPEDSEKFLAALSELDRDRHGWAVDESTLGCHGQTGRTSRSDLSITRIPFEGPAHFSICVKDVSEQERLTRRSSSLAEDGVAWPYGQWYRS